MTMAIAHRRAAAEGFWERRCARAAAFRSSDTGATHPPRGTASGGLTAGGTAVMAALIPRGLRLRT